MPQIKDIILAGDLNQFIGSNEIQQFFYELGVKDIHSTFNKIEFDQIDNTFVQGSKPIDIVAITSELMKCVEG